MLFLVRLWEDYSIRLKNALLESDVLVWGKSTSLNGTITRNNITTKCPLLTVRRWIYGGRHLVFTKVFFFFSTSFRAVHFCDLQNKDMKPEFRLTNNSVVNKCKSR